MGGKGGSCCSMNPPTTLTSKSALFGKYGHFPVYAIVGVHLYAVLHGGSWAIAAAGEGSAKVSYFLPHYHNLVIEPPISTVCPMLV